MYVSRGWHKGKEDQKSDAGAESGYFFELCTLNPDDHKMYLMKLSALLFTFILLGCGGSLTDEQRKQMKKNMELNKIVRVTEVEITEAAFDKGRETIEIIESFKGDSTKIDSIIDVSKGRIHYIRPGISNAQELEQQLVDAYLADESGIPRDNVQKVRNNDGGFDSLLYTKPVVTKLPDGSDQLVGVWNIWLPKKELILEIGRKR
jgi:hypothetical protein